jgi:hypothetical protein
MIVNGYVCRPFVSFWIIRHEQAMFEKTELSFQIPKRYYLGDRKGVE